MKTKKYCNVYYVENNEFGDKFICGNIYHDKIDTVKCILNNNDYAEVVDSNKSKLTYVKTIVFEVKEEEDR